MKASLKCLSELESLFLKTKVIKLKWFNLFQDMEGIKLDDVDTSDVQLDDEDLLED